MEAVKLYPYQVGAVQSVYQYLRNKGDGNPCVVIPTGGGKSYVIAQLCRDMYESGCRVLVLAHVKELLAQNADKLRKIATDLPIGLYSAGLNSRQIAPITIAGIQSAYKKAALLGKVDMLIVDEAHRIPPDGEGTYQRLIQDLKAINPDLRIVGLTATPFRMKSGLICGPQKILTDICYEVMVKELIVEGYICKLTSRAGIATVDTSGLHIRMGEFVAEEVEELMDKAELIRAAVKEIIEKAHDRKACLVFAAGVDHALHVAAEFRSQLGEPEPGELFSRDSVVATIFGKTPREERDRTVQAFRDGKVKFLVNVQVLTTGFDVPHVDMIALMRPTMSGGLYSQMVGRGFRKSEGKENCLVLDFGGNVVRHGPVDCILPGAYRNTEQEEEQKGKMCPSCRAVVDPAFEKCPECGATMPLPERRERKINKAASSSADILSGESEFIDWDVRFVEYSTHVKKDNGSRTMRVDYGVGFLSTDTVADFVAFEHEGYARKKAVQWWRKRTDAPVPDNIEDAVELANMGVLAVPSKVTLQYISGQKYPKIAHYELGEKPNWEEILLKNLPS